MAVNRASATATISFSLVVLAAAAAPLSIEDRISGGLWGLFVGDALAMPVHWYYRGPEQIRQDFNGSTISGYERAVHPYPESIMQLSSTGGAGRGSDKGDVIGGVILHDKKKYWRRGGQYHYHHTLEAGENTLEASLARVLIRSLTNNGGFFSAERFRSMYIEFMTTPGSHNDTYASTCHRMFFKKWRDGVPPEQCPDNDGHNVDTIDGLVLPAVVLLVELGAGRSATEAAASAVQALSVTRQAPKLADYINALADMLAAILSGSPIDAVVGEFFPQVEKEVRRRKDQPDPIVACYIDGSFPALLFFLSKYAPESVADALLASTNAGGENVHRNAVFGTLLGASAGIHDVSRDLRGGLVAHAELEGEITHLLEMVRIRRELSEL